MNQSLKILHKGIKNIIFDLGGVILNIDYQRSVQAFKNLGLSNFENLYSQASQNNIFDLFETGKISTREFRNELREASQLNLSDIEIDNAWNSMLLDLPQERIDFLQKINKKYRIFLLSNTNQIHIEKFIENIHKQFHENILDNVFEKVYFSSQIGYRKPNADAFQYVLDDSKLLASETFFIDDSQQHVIGAEQAGLHAALLDKNHDILQFFRGWI